MGDERLPVSPDPSEPADHFAWPSAGDSDVEVLRPEFSFATTVRYLLPWSPIIFLFFLVATLVGGMIGLYGLMGMPGPLLFGLLGAAIYTAVLVYAHRRQSLAVTVLVSPVGVECHDSLGTRQRLRWRDVAAIGRVQQFMTHRAPRSIAWDPASAQGRTAVGGPLYPVSDGLLGWGERIPPSGGSQPGRLQAVMEAQPRDRQSRMAWVAIPFNAAGRPGRDNPLLAGAWRYRPDLFSGFSASG